MQFPAPSVATAAQRQAHVVHAGGTVTRDVPLINAAGAALTAPEATALRADAAVRVVTPHERRGDTVGGDVRPDPMRTAYNQSAQTPSIWPQATGKGIGVAVIDTGIQGNLPDFMASQSNSTSRVIASAVVNPNATSAGDAYGHGTMVAGLISGNGGDRASTDPLFGKYAGAAPDANLISIKPPTSRATRACSTCMNGIQFAIDHQSRRTTFAF